MLLLATDGLTNTVSDSEIEEILTSADTLRHGCERLIDLALERGAPDNVTVAALRR